MDDVHAKEIGRLALRSKDYAGGTTLGWFDVDDPEMQPGVCRDLTSHQSIPSTANQWALLPRLPDESAIRLITVLPELKEGFPECQVDIGSTHDDFMTLSYTWGHPKFQKPIWLNGSQFHVGHHLWQFLHIARKNYPNLPIWIDALCIDQSNKSEQSEQVQRMDGIYRASSQTLTFLATSPLKYLGEAQELQDFDPSLQKCMTALKALAHSYMASESYHDDSEAVSVLKLVIRITCHAYWARLWVIQENAISGYDNIVIFGNVKMSFSQLSKVLEYLCCDFMHSVQGKYSGTKHSRRELDNSSDFSYDFSWPLERRAQSSETCGEPNTVEECALDVLECVGDGTRKSLITGDSVERFEMDSAGLGLGRRQLLNMMFDLQTSLCSDRRDKIYGLVTFLKPDDKFKVNYEEDVYSLYYRACNYFASEPAVTVVRQSFGTMRSSKTSSTHSKLQSKANKWVTVVRNVSTSLDLGILDLFFGDSEARTSIVSVTYTADDLNISPDHAAVSCSLTDSPPTDASADFSVNEGKSCAYAWCRHCHRRVMFLDHGLCRYEDCVIQCHRLSTGSGEESRIRPDYDHLILLADKSGDHYSVRAFASEIDPKLTPSTHRPTSEQSRLYSIEHIGWIIHLDEQFRGRSSQPRPVTATPASTDLEKQLELRNNFHAEIGQLIATGNQLTERNVHELGLEEKAEYHFLESINRHLKPHKSSFT